MSSNTTDMDPPVSRGGAVRRSTPAFLAWAMTARQYKQNVRPKTPPAPPNTPTLPASTLPVPAWDPPVSAAAPAPAPTPSANGMASAAATAGPGDGAALELEGSSALLEGSEPMDWVDILLADAWARGMIRGMGPLGKEIGFPGAEVAQVKGLVEPPLHPDVGVPGAGGARP